MSTSPQETNVIDLEEVTKTFKIGFFKREPRAALQRVDLRVSRGSAFGFLGPNGAGKTTTIKILIGLIAPTSGRVSLFGMSPADRRARQNVGYLPENPSLPDGLTGTEVLELMWALSKKGTLSASDEIARVLKLVDLTYAADMVVRKYSKGMVQRLGIAQALLNDPDLVILDEPMSGLDPVGRREIKDLILQLRRAGKTILFSTHIISDVEEICDDLAIIVKGKIVRSGSVASLIGTATRRMEVLATSVPPDFQIQSTSSGTVSQFLVDSQADLRPLIESLWAKGAQVLAVKPTHYGLEDVFIDAIKSSAGNKVEVMP